jgi:hypothetical protein
MNLRVGTRKRVAAWMVGVLLLAQWLVSAYACPPAVQGGVVQGVAVTAAALPDCHDTTVDADPGNPALCKAHCQVGDQVASPGTGSGADVLVALLPALGLVAFDSPVLPQAPAGGFHWATSGAPPPGWPPLYLVLQALRN